MYREIFFLTLLMIKFLQQIQSVSSRYTPKIDADGIAHGFLKTKTICNL